MCGIAGILNLDRRHAPPAIGLLGQMIKTLEHRGPDGFGVYRDERVGLAHARLSVVDLETGGQPMCNEDESMWIVFNGEIFNYVELRAELERRGHQFRTRSDTEVILHAFEQWESECFLRFNGQWALALWDSREKRLVLSRDRMGILPLYVSEHDGRIWFGSEVKAIFADPAIPRQIDAHGLNQVFTYWAPIAPTTVFEGIEELPPATVRVYADGRRVQDWNYWTPAFLRAGENGHGTTLQDATEALKQKLSRATSLRVLRSDVAVGSYLSGGLDSSYVTALGSQERDGEFDTFSVRFDDPEFDEGEHQRVLAGALGTHHHEVLAGGRDIAALFPRVIWHAERPLLRTAAAPLLLLSELVHSAGCKVVLTGEGADEILAGYDIFKEAKIREFMSRAPKSAMRPLLLDRLYNYLGRSPQEVRNMALRFWQKGMHRVNEPGFSHFPRWTTTSSLKRFLSPEFAVDQGENLEAVSSRCLPEAFAAWDLLSQAQYLEMVILLPGYLLSSQGDRMLMANSVEGRFPYLDPEVVDLCNGFPSYYKMAGLNEKAILKRAARGRVPSGILDRTKQPYRAPDAECFLGPQSPAYVDALLSAEALKEFAVFDRDAVRAFCDKLNLAREGERGKRPLGNSDNMAFVGILSTQLLCQRFLSGKRSSDSVHEYQVFIDRVSAPAFRVA